MTCFVRTPARPRINIAIRLASIAVVLASIPADAAQKKQCKPQINVDGEASAAGFGGSVITPITLDKANKAARVRAQRNWVKWASATHGGAYADPRLANGFSITCAKQGVPALSVLCTARGFPCRADNAPAPGRVLNRIPSRVLNSPN